MASGQPRFTDMVIRTGTEHFTITDAHPYHQPVGHTDHKGAGVYIIAYDARCPLCREERKEHAPGR